MRARAGRGFVSCLILLVKGVFFAFIFIWLRSEICNSRKIVALCLNCLFVVALHFLHICHAKIPCAFVFLTCNNLIMDGGNGLARNEKGASK